MKLIDTHTHLYSEQFADDRDEMISRAIDKGVEKFFMPNIDSSSIAGMKELVKKYPEHCYAMMGLHPSSVNTEYQQELEKVREELETGNYKGIGEIGMDLYWEKKYRKQQEAAFRQQIEWAKEFKLPIVIHCRDAFDEILSILDEVNEASLSGIFHCFTGTLEQAKHILAYGDFKLGIGGVVSFKNSGLDKVVSQLSLNDLVLETDAPYLAPAPFRGKRNESAYLQLIAKKLAEIFNVSLDEIAEKSSINAMKIFKLHG